MTNIRLWRACALFALASATIMLGFGAMPGLSECGGSDAVIRFEFANSAADVTNRVRNPACAQGQYYALWWDTILFIPAYLCFLVLALLALRGERRRLAGVGIAMAVAGALADQVEGTRMFAILGNMPGEPAHFAVLFWAVRIKFGLLAGATFIIGLLLARRGRRHWPAAVLIMIGSIISIAGLVTPDLPWISLGGVISWLPIIITAQFIAWRRAAPVGLS
jgi:hypothetical protein